MDCFKTAVLKMGIPLETAVKCVTVNPARSIGIYDKVGSIEAGKSADLVALNDRLDIKAVINGGRIRFV
jgi:N-acetylglucosamine-6-phosphate deacetylase